MPTKKIYTNTIAQIASKLITAVISIGLIKILTDYLSITEFGEYNKIYNFLSIFSVIADLGLYTITVRELSQTEDQQQREKIANSVLTLRTLSGMLIIWLSLLIASFLPSYQSASTLVGILIVWFFTLFGLINSSLMSYLQATLQTEFSIVANTLGKITTFVTILLFAYDIWFVRSLDALVLVLLAGLLGNIVMTVLTYWYTRKTLMIRFAWDTTVIRGILKESLPYGLALFLSVIFFKVDIVLLSLLEPTERANISIALYSVPMKIVEVGMMYGTIFLNSLLPVLTKSLQQDDHTMIEKLTDKGYTLLLFAGITISTLLMGFPREILSIVSKSTFIEHTGIPYTWDQILMIVSGIFVCYFLSSLSLYILIALGRQREIIRLNLIVAILNALGNLLVIPVYSFYGSALVSVSCQILLVILTTYTVRTYIPWKKLFPRIILFPLIAFLSLSLSLFFIENMRGDLVRVILGGTIFLVLSTVGFLGVRSTMRYIAK